MSYTDVLPSFFTTVYFDSVSYIDIFWTFFSFNMLPVNVEQETTIFLLCSCKDVASCVLLLRLCL